MIFGKHINKYYLRYSYLILLAVLALVVVDYFQLLIPEVYGTIVDSLKDGIFTTELLSQLMAKMLLIMACMVIGRFAWRACFFNAEVGVENDLRQDMFDHCKELSQEFYSKNKVGNLMSLFTNDIETIQVCVSWGTLMTFDVLGLGSLSLYHMFMTNKLLTLLSLIPLLLMIGIGLIEGKYIEKKWDERQESFSKLSDFAQETFSGIAVIRAFVKEASELMRFKKLNRNNEKVNVEFVKLSTLMHILVGILVNTVLIVILGFGGYLVYNQTITVGKLMEFSGYFTTIIWPMLAIGELIDLTSRGRASLKRIGEFIDSKIDVKDREDVLEHQVIRGDIEFSHLTFRYPDADYDALSDVSFKIAAGQNVGIIGKTGCGKTTIVDLILRTYNVPDGSVLIDGIDVNKLSIHNLREYCSYVPQDNFLFSDTIHNNIAFAFEDGERTDDEVENAADLAGIKEDIQDFPNQFQTVLGERGVTVSGGQKQRISIARALIKDASILILDDSLSAVDTKTESVILANLKKTRQGKTTLFIAHRVSTVENMDQILYVEDGKILAMGTHDELLKCCAPYANLVELQRLENEVGGNA